MRNSDKYVELLRKVDLNDKRAANGLREHMLRESNSLTNREFHFLIEEIVAQFNDMGHLKFFISFNFLLRGANKTFNTVFRHLFDSANSFDDYIFLQREALGQIYQQLLFFRKKVQKYNSNDLLDEINNLVELSYKLYSADALYECFTLLDIVADLIAIVNKFPFKKNTILYFSMLFNIFLSRGCIFSAVNALYRLICIDKKVNLKEKYVQALADLMHLKDSEEEHSKMFCGLPSVSSRTFQQEAKNVEYEQDVLLHLNEEFLDNFAFYRENVRKTFECDDEMLKFVSFLRLNNFNFSLDDGILIFDGTYSKKSNSAKVFEILKGMKDQKDSVVTRNVEATRIKENLKREKMIKETLITSDREENRDKTVKEEKKIWEDRFTKNFNLFRIYQIKSQLADDPNDLKLRQCQLDMDFQRDFEKKERLRGLYEQRKDDIVELLKKYEERKQKGYQPVAARQEEAKAIKGSWRTATPESFKTESVYKPSVGYGKPTEGSVYQPPKFTRETSAFEPREAVKPNIYDPSSIRKPKPTSFESKDTSRSAFYEPSKKLQSLSFESKDTSRSAFYEPSKIGKPASKDVNTADESKVYKFVRKDFVDAGAVDQTSQSKNVGLHSASNLSSPDEKPEKEIRKGESWRTAKK